MRFGHAPLVIAVTRSRDLDVLIAKLLISSDVFCRAADQTGCCVHVLTAVLHDFFPGLQLLE